MNKRLRITPFILFFILNCNVLALGHALDVNDSNYVVIGAFAVQDNATKFVEDAKKLSFKAEYAIHTTRKLYYVYVLHTAKAKLAFAEAIKIRTETPYSDTWVYQGLLGINSDGKSGADVNPVTEQKLSRVEPTNTSSADMATLETQKMAANDLRVKERKPSDSSLIGSPVRTPFEADKETGGKGFIFKIASVSGSELKGEVDLINSERLSKVASYEGNTRAYIKPINKSGKITLICEVFGYRKSQLELNYDMPDSTSGVVIENGNVVVPFELMRLQRGDISAMYNVFFFKDAAIMRPESQYEVNSLRDMMKENPAYKIKLHGHTNGNSSGKIITRGDSKNFFSLSGTKDGFGSAKELSEERAEAIRGFLISEGIDSERIIVKAWGGKKPIHEKESSKAHENIRVEVEILED